MGINEGTQKKNQRQVGREREIGNLLVIRVRGNFFQSVQEGMRRNLRWPWNPVTTALPPEVAWVIPAGWCDWQTGQDAASSHTPCALGQQTLHSSLLTGHQSKCKEKFGVSLALLLHI